MAAETGKEGVEAAVAAAIQAREQVLSDVIADIAEEERGRFMTICTDYFPDTISLVDKAVLVSILLQVGYINIDDDEYDLRIDFDGIECFALGWYFEIDDLGRITKVRIGYPEEVDDEVNDLEPYNLPARIARLDKLTDLEVACCLSLPAKELSSLPHLKTLRFLKCSNLLENFPFQMELKYLTTLRIADCRFQSSSPFFKWMQQLSVLEHLNIYEMEENDIDSILSILRTIDMKFQDKLKYIRLCKSKMNNTRFETLVFEILPRFPNVSRLDLTINEIQSVRHIVDRIKNDTTCFVSKSLRLLRFGATSILDKVEENDPNEKAVLLSFLRIYNTVCNLGGFREGDYSFDLQYALRINHAGRRLIEGGGHRVESIPLSLWPTILERAYEKSEHSICTSKTLKNATGLYYLLRNGPALAGRPSLGGKGRLSSSSDINDDGNDKDDNNKDDNYKDDRAKENTPKKRKLAESKRVSETTNDHDDDNDNDNGRSKKNAPDN